MYLETAAWRIADHRKTWLPKSSWTNKTAYQKRVWFARHVVGPGHITERARSVYEMYSHPRTPENERNAARMALARMGLTPEIMESGGEEHVAPNAMMHYRGCSDRELAQLAREAEELARRRGISLHEAWDVMEGLT